METITTQYVQVKCKVDNISEILNTIEKNMSVYEIMDYKVVESGKVGILVLIVRCAIIGDKAVDFGTIGI